VEAKLKALWAKLNTDISELWASSKIFVILFGVVILIIKFHDLLMSLIVADSKSIENSAVKQDAVLSKQENAANTAADKLVSDAQKLPSTEGGITDDWNKK